MAKQNLDLQARTQGFDEAARDVGKLDEAQRAATDETRDATDATDGLAQSQRQATDAGQELSGATGRLGNALAQLGLGRLAQAFSAVNNLMQVIARSTIPELVGALKLALVAAGGLLAVFKKFLLLTGVIAVLATIANRFRKIRDEVRAATAALREHREELDRLQGEERDLEREIASQSDVSGVPMTAAQVRIAREHIQSLSRDVPGLDPAAAAQAAGMFGGRLDRGQLLTAAVLQQIGALDVPADATPAQRMGALSAAAQANRGRVQAFIQRERDFAKFAADRAQLEASGAAGTTSELRALARREARPGVPESVIEESVEQVQDRFALQQAGGEGRFIESLRIRRRMGGRSSLADQIAALVVQELKRTAGPSGNVSLNAPHAKFNVPGPNRPGKVVPQQRLQRMGESMQ